jgi:hypothetical protein
MCRLARQSLRESGGTGPGVFTVDGTPVSLDQLGDRAAVSQTRA